MITVVTAEARARRRKRSKARGKALQEKFGFRFPLPALLARRTEKDRRDAARANCSPTISRR